MFKFHHNALKNSDCLKEKTMPLISALNSKTAFFQAVVLNIMLLCSVGLCFTSEEPTGNLSENVSPLQKSKMILGCFGAGKKLELYTEISHNLLYVGDSLYVEVSLINRDDAEVTLPPSQLDIKTANTANEFIAAAVYCVKTYNIFLEFPEGKRYNCSGEYVDRFSTDRLSNQCYASPPAQTLAPGFKRNYLSLRVDLPALEDLPSFSKMLAENNEGSQKGKLVIQVWGITGSAADSPDEFIYEVSIQKRGERENQLLNKMFWNTPPHFFPVSSKPYGGYYLNKYSVLTWRYNVGRLIPNNINSKIDEFSGTSIEEKNTQSSVLGEICTIGGPMPLTLVRPFDVRKPGPPLAPKTPEGWKELESQFENGTLKDELKMTRLLAEFYNLEQEQQIYEKQQEIILWLNSLPKLQARVLAQFAHRTTNEKLKVRSEALHEKLKAFHNYGYTEDISARSPCPHM